MTFSTKYKKPILYIIFSFCLVLSLQAQEILIANKKTQEPIVGAAIYNQDQSRSVITKFDGKANLDIFNPDDILFFKHIAFDVLSVEKSRIKGDVIYLEPLTQGLEEIVISASKFKQDKRDVPNKIVNFNAKSIAFTNPQTSADLLEKTGQVFIQKSQLGGGSPIIRGFSTNRLLITVDGVRMNNAIFRGGNLQNVISIDPFTIQNTEVSLGAGSVIYGSDAIGGVMSFYTQKPQLSYTDSTYYKTTATLRYATANQEKTAHLGVNYGFKKWAFITNASFSDFNDLKMGSHGPNDYLRPEFVVTTNNQDQIVSNSEPKLQKNSGYNQINVMQKVRYEPKDNLSFNLGLFYTSTSNTPRYDRLIRYRGEELRSAEWYYGPQRWFMSNLNITKLSSSSNLYDKIQATVAYQNFQESRIDRDYQSVFKSIKEEAVNAVSFNLDLEKTLNPKTKISYGLEYIYNKVNSKAKEENIETTETSNIVTRYPDNATWQSLAAYLSLKYKPNSKFVFQSGLRFNKVLSKANFEANNVYLNLPFNEAKNNSEALTGTAGMSWIPNKTLQWKLNFSTAFRAPNIDDIGKVFDSEPGSVVVPNNNLKPEYAYGGELGLLLNFDDVLILDMATYYTYLDNALVRRDGDLNGETEIVYNGELSNVQSIQNASKSYIYGFEIGAKLNVSKNLALSSQYNVVGGTDETDEVEYPVRHVAPNFGNTRLTWTKNKFKADASVNYNGELSYYDLAPSEVSKDYIYALDNNGNPYSPSWYTLNLTAQYELNSFANLTIGLENITDQRYKTYSSGIAAPGRNLITSIKFVL
ncbi:TonB-dependent siderophore receptor [Lacinutrix sp. MedPE-SW]|uniref:TonB-dependent receptor plug domain-containing protein n=1 Tax=Lacinutrix sp. MedPE-SW TaxID=1860087 RepID=UPI0009180A23|nr:TonB-dependent receptor [Lacinutrix sp. MedPE-SW]OIQ17770.1 MAG: TonB-dependent receptor [Lacinutrix sp. MedPE-SW]